MTSGQASWIAYEKPNDAVVTRKNPWESGWGKNDQFAPVDDMGGVALFRKQFTVSGLASARIDVTALGVNIEYFPTHIAGLPVAVNVNCHVARHAEAVI